MAQHPDQPQRQQGQPLHTDKHRVPVNITLIFALAVAAFGLVTLVKNRDFPLTLIVGLGVAIFTWFTSPREYQIYQDALVIVYGRPRVKVIYFNQITQLDVLQLVIGERLRVMLRNGRREVLQTRDPQTFHARFQGALDDFRRAHPELALPEQGSEERQPAENTPPLGEGRGGSSEQRPERRRSVYRSLFPIALLILAAGLLLVLSRSCSAAA